MYLKRIQIQGFKSFPDKTVIEFRDGITGIVGPNGSGKSNISDAIRWALGEQSTKLLRGNKMEDVIFAGSRKRKALGFAEVILVFDNSDKKIPLEYNEVSIKRRVFRSGESEYSINNTVCRLRDVRDLFMDTGIGKDGYSIVGQGKIDEVLSTKPEERRNIFEEAAGIVKYKTRKEEAERKLKRTEENVLRVEDILRELNSRHDYLKKESEKARRYKAIDEELNSMELDLLIRKADIVEKKLKELRTSKLNISKNKEELESNIEVLRKKISSNEEISEKTELKIRELDSLYNRNNEELLKYNNEKTVLEESKRYKLLENKRFEKEILENKKKIEKNKEDNKKQLEENEKLEKQLFSIKKDFEEEESKLKIKLDLILKEEMKIEEEKDNMVSYYNRITDKKGELSNLDNFKRTIINQSDDIEKEIKNINEERKNIENRLEILDKNISDEEAKGKNIGNELNKLKEEVLNIEETKEKIKTNIENNNISLNMNKSQYNMNMNMQENYEGYYRSVKALMVNSKKDSSLDKNIVGVIADLIEVEEEYTKAIEIALGSNIQNIVTPNEDSAKFLIEYLKNSKLGRATFLPLNIIKGRRFNLNNIDFKEFGIIGIASDIIKYNNDYKDIMENLLGRVIITKNMDSSIKLARRLNHSVRIVTLDGDVINPGGSMTGGSIYSKGSNLLSRKNVLKDLADEREKLADENKSYTEKLNSIIDKYKKMKSREIELEENLRETRLNYDRFINERESISSNYTRVLERAEKLTEDHNYFNKENLSMEEKKKKLEEEIHDMELHNSKLKEKLNELMVKFKENKEENERITQKITDLRIKVGSLEEEYRFNKERLKNLLEMNKSLEKDIVDREEELLNNKKSIEEVELKIEEKESTISEINNKNKVLQTRKSDLQKEREDVNKLLKELKNQDLSLFKDLEKVKQDLNQVELNITKNKVHYENHIAEIEEGFNIEYKEGLKQNHIELDYDELYEMILINRSEIEKLGIVNLGAIEEYTTVKERLDFKNEQISDLNRAKEDLFKIIKDMEKEMKVKFIKSFKEIRSNFNDVFKILFNGGKADLILEDEDNMLDCGIEIKAQPPGKKFQSLSLLSGGERSLTAVALLFSILEMKPAPFCILDEIDAALDESNIDRYTKYLQRFSDETQFIMITHRKRTMEIADTIYGVTMEEEGVSKTISIELSDLEEDN